MFPLPISRPLRWGGLFLLFCVAGNGDGSDLERAQTLLNQGSLQQAISLLRTTVRDEPENGSAHLLLGAALAQVPRRSEAISSIARALELQPRSAAAHHTAGLSLARLGEHDSARQAFEKALELDPDLGSTHLSLALLLAQREEYSEAAQHISQSIELEQDPNRLAYLHHLLGGLYNDQDMPEKAAASFEQSIASQPDYGPAYLALAMTRKRLLQDEEVLPLLKKAVGLDPGNPTARYNLGLEYLRRGDAKEASSHLLAAHRGDPGDRTVLNNLARALHRAGRKEEYEIHAAKLAAMIQASDKTRAGELKAGQLNNEGIEFEKSRNHVQALHKYRSAVEIDPINPVFRRNLALVLCRLDRWDEGISELKEILRQHPGDEQTTRTLHIALEQAELARRK